MIEKILKSFNQSLSQDEKHQVEAWKSESDDNLKALQELTAIHNASEKLLSYQSFDKDEAWANVSSKTGIDKESKVYKMPSWLKSIAAIFVLGFAAFFLLKDQVTNSPEVYKTYSTADAFQNINLVDGTQVILDKTSTLKILDKRYVTLEGRASFKVTTMPDKDNFTIKLNGGKVTVLGTQFTVLSTEDMLEVSVVEGHVRIDYEGRSIDLYTNDIVQLTGNQLAVTKDNYTNTNSWTSHELIFKDETIDRVLVDLSKHFKQQIILDKSIKNTDHCLLTTKFSNPELSDVLAELKTIFNAEITKKDNTYVITSIKC